MYFKLSYASTARKNAYLSHLLSLQLCAMNHTGELMELKNNCFLLLWKFSFESLGSATVKLGLLKGEYGIDRIGNLGCY